MKLEQLKALIIEDLGGLYENQADRNDFENAICNTNNVWEIKDVLEEYGWDRQGALNIIFRHSIQD